jgi:hypothetical protein
MGGASSKTTTKVTNQIINEAVAKNIQQTSASGTGKQVISVSGSGNKVCKNDMNMSISVIAKADFNNELAMKTQNDITSKLQAASEASSNMFGLAPAKSETNSEVSNLVKNAFTMENIQKCIGEVDTSQTIDVSGNGNEVCENKMLAAATLVVDCVGKNTGVLDAINKLDNSVDASSTAKNQGLLESLLGGCPDFGLGGIGTCLIVIGLMCLIGFAAYLYFTSSGHGAAPAQIMPKSVMDSLSSAGLGSSFGTATPSFGSSFGTATPSFGSSYGAPTPSIGSLESAFTRPPSLLGGF